MRILPAVACAFVLISGWSQPAFSAVEWLRGVTVTETLRRSDGIYGNCMIKSNKNATINCAAEWFTASCSGDFGSASAGAQKFDLAVAAMITNKTIKFQVNDAKKHNGFCFIDDLRLEG